MKMRNFAWLFASLLLGGCVLGDAEVDPNAVAAREVHAAFVRSEKGFGLDPNRNVFTESFEASTLGNWVSTQAGSDLWRVGTQQRHFGSYSLTYGQGNVIGKGIDWGEATLATKDVISLAQATKPALILFARFDQQGATSDQTAFRVEASTDLGFTWEPLTPLGSTEALIDSAKANREWKRFRFDLTSYAGQGIRLRINLKATLSSRRLLYLDDLLVVETGG